MIFNDFQTNIHNIKTLEYKMMQKYLNFSHGEESRSFKPGVCSAHMVS